MIIGFSILGIGPGMVLSYYIVRFKILPFRLVPLNARGATESET